MKTRGFDQLWFEALSLAERAAVINTSGVTFKARDLEHGNKRLLKWMTHPALAQSDAFDARLSMDGVDQALLLQLLSDPVITLDELQDNCPEWAATLGRLFDELTFAEGCGNQSPKLGGFLYPLAPFLNEGMGLLARTLSRIHASAGHCVPWNDSQVTQLVLNRLARTLILAAQYALVLELNVSRLRGELLTSSPEERFNEFCERFLQREISMRFYAEYPVLARLLCERTRDWARFTDDFLSHLATDWSGISENIFAGSRARMLVDLVGNAGDMHEGGRSVMILRFDSGERLVYKPRSQAVDLHFAELSTWCNSNGWEPKFRTLRVIDRGDHGWVEYAEDGHCDSPNDVQSFFRKTGGLLALLYLLNATDFHYENLVAAGSDPIPVDLESLFHPRTSRLSQNAMMRNMDGMVEQTVLHIGLLPRLLDFGAEGKGLDLSGLGGAEGQLSPFQTLRGQEVGTDEMRFVQARASLKGARNRLKVDGRWIPVQDHIDELLNGFTDLYRCLMRNRSGLCEAGGPLRAFEDDDIRVIFRGTIYYGQLMQQSLHPDFLRSGLERDRLLDSVWYGTGDKPSLRRLVSAERVDLARGDIPIFRTHVSSRDVRTSCNGVISNLFENSGMDEVETRLTSMDEEDLERQKWLIRASLGGTSDESSRNEHEDAAEIPQDPKQPDVDLLSAAEAVADTIARSAYICDGLINWMTIGTLNHNTWNVSPCSISLYDGLSGICWFMAALEASTHREQHRELAGRILRTILTYVESLHKLRSGALRPSAYSGEGSVIYLLCFLAGLWEDPSLLARAIEIATDCGRSIEQDVALDWLGGIAGYACVLESLHFLTHDSSVAEQISRCGERLLATAQPIHEGVGWPAKWAENKALTGFGHGSAGFSLALFRIGTFTGDSRFTDAAMSSIAFENTHYDEVRGSWSDLAPRMSTRERVAWCFGSPGIGMARLACLSHMDNTIIRNDIDAALIDTCKKGFRRNHSLCHGDLGNAEFLLQAGRQMDRPQLIGEAIAHVARCANGSWRCGTPGGLETTSFMLGLAGIGYCLLRIAGSRELPSVLTLERLPTPIRIP
jgi:type 2 lantibiotic biosynthesis protein LanM